MIRLLPFLALSALLVAGCASSPTASTTTQFICADGSCSRAPKAQAYFYPDQVRDIERAFAKTMADRDHAAFKRFLAEDAIFFDGNTAIRGKQRVADLWKGYFNDPKAPFSWEPTVVQVLDSGNLAFTSGPVHDPDGKLIGRFNSVWRQEAPGVWRIVFDKGSEVCNCEAKIDTERAIISPSQLGTPMPIAPEAPATPDYLQPTAPAPVPGG